MIFSSISKYIFLTLFLFSMVGCEQYISPCSCAKNLIKSTKGFDPNLDERCNSHLESLNEKDAETWTDSMMNCVSQKRNP